MDAVQSLQYFMLFLCGIAGVMVAGTGMIIYLLCRVERRTNLPLAHRPAHGLGALSNRR
jgi:hypothetical protein